MIKSLYYFVMMIYVGWVSTFSLIAEPLKVVTLSTVLTDFVKNVGGDAVEIMPMIKEGQDPHEFNPTVAQMKKMSEARLIFASGKGMEGYLGKLKDSSTGKTEIIDVGAAVPSLWSEETCEYTHAGHDHHSHSADGKVEDPHWWQSITNAINAVKTIRDALIKADPGKKAVFDQNATAYIKELEALSKWTDTQIALLARDKRILITSHDALGYFAQDYGFKIYAIDGISTAETATSKHVGSVVQIIKDKGVKAIFAESITNPKVQKQIEKETGARVAGVLYSDGLGQGDSGTYTGMYRHNISTIVGALK